MVNGYKGSDTNQDSCGTGHISETVTNLNISSYLEVLHRNHPGIVSLSFVAFDFDGASFLWYYTMSDFCKPIFRFGQRQLEPGMRTVFAVKIDPSLQFKNKT